MLLENVADILAVLGSNMVLYTVEYLQVVPNAPPVQHMCIHYQRPRNLTNHEGKILFSIHSSNVRYTLSPEMTDKAMLAISLFGGMPGANFDKAIEHVEAEVLSVTVDLCSDMESFHNVQVVDIGMSVTPNFVIELHLEKLPPARYSSQAKFFNSLTPNVQRFNTYRLDLESIERKPLV